MRRSPSAPSQRRADRSELADLVRERPYRALRMARELLRQGVTEDEGAKGAWAFDAARSLAAALFEVTGRDACLRLCDLYAALELPELRLEHDRRRGVALEAGAAGDALAAEREMRAALALAEELGDPFLAGEARRELGRALSGRPRAPPEAAALLAGCLAFDLAEGDLPGAALDRRLLGDLAFRRGELAAALEHYEASLALAARTDEPAPVPDAELGVVYAHLGRYGAARERLEAALAGGERVDSPGLVAYALTNLGTLESARGEYAAGLELLERALSASRAAGDIASEAAALVSLGGIQSELGRLEDSRATLERALALLPAGTGAAVLRGYALQALGVTHLDAGRAQEARAAFDAAAAELERVGHRAGLVEVARQRARAALALGDLARARELFERVAAQGAGPFQRALALTGLAETFERQGAAEEAERHYRAALACGVPLDTAEATWRARFGLARILEARGDTRAALAAFAAAIDEVEALRSGARVPALRLRYLENKLSLYRRGALAAARAGDLERGFQWTEAAKARVLLERCAARGERSEVAPATPSQARLAAVEGEIALAEFRYHGTLERAADDERRAALRAELAGLRARREEARVALELAAPVHATLAGIASAPSLARLEVALAEGVALVEFLVDSHACAAWVVRRDGGRLVPLVVSAPELEGLVARLYRPVEDLRAGAVDLATLDFDARAARALYDALVLPLEEDLRGAASVWIVPDGALWRAPFGAFLRSREKRAVDPACLYRQFADCRFWIDECALGVLPSASFLVAAGAPRGPLGIPCGPLGSALGIADPEPAPGAGGPLFGAQRELAAVRASAGTAAWRVLIGAGATEPAFLGAAHGADWIHAAVHAELDDRRPGYSRLALAPADGHDGWLHAFEVEELPLHVTRVVLSACESAGPALSGEGLLGLARAFLIAGARSVLATTWTVDDEASATFMAGYYAALLAGREPLAALREAQLGMRAAGREGISYAHPFFWAGYVHVGAP